MSMHKPNLRREMALALLLLLSGCWMLPTVIFFVGSRLFGAYRVSGAGLSVFYSDFGKDLATAQPAAWAIALGPMLLVYLIRAVLGAGSSKWQTPDEPSRPSRVEPGVRS